LTQKHIHTKKNCIWSDFSTEYHPGTALVKESILFYLQTWGNASYAEQWFQLFCTLSLLW